MAALNASMYGYGGHSAYIPMPAPQRPEQFTFWDEQKIRDTVKRKYVLEHIGGQRGADNLALKQRLDTPISFGEGLTESTYVEWIVEHASKFFLVLAELGVPEKIFGVVDGSWGDDDLPLTPEMAAALGLESAALEKRFLKKQHMFMLRLLGAGEHVDYLEEETVALECASGKRQGTAAGATGLLADKVYFPRDRDNFYMRAEVPLAGSDSKHAIGRDVFFEEVAASRAISHEHIVSIFASYTHQDHGYVLFSPACELNLAQFIRYTPHTFKAMSKQRRRRVLLEWLHCLADALAHMYEKGVAHRDIRPRSIMIDQTRNSILFADIGNLKRLDPTPKQQNAQIQDVELYEYAAPELWQRAMTSYGSSSPSNTTFSGRAHRKTSASSPSGTSQVSVSSNDYPQSPISPVSSSGNSNILHIGLSHWVATSNNPSKSDVFSLGCIFLDIVSFLMKRRTSAFIAHRIKRQRRPRQSATPDQSFHANLGQVETWVDGLESDAEKKDDATLSCILRLIRSMIERDPSERPHPRQVSYSLFKILESEFVTAAEQERPTTSKTSISKTSHQIGEGPKLHCKPTMDPETTMLQLGMVTDLKLWPTSGTTRTHTSTSTSSSSSGGIGGDDRSGLFGWTAELCDDDSVIHGVKRLTTSSSNTSGNSIESSTLDNGGENTKSIRMKRSVSRFFRFT
ncbi:kinase-like domain-containing protein [Peziza echinospora]|nr:kinase-like domain-containing protein [Peziza echinospora]